MILSKLQSVFQESSPKIMLNAWSVALSLTAGYLIYRLVTRKKNLPPGPRGLPLIGILHELKDPLYTHLDFDRFTKIYGDVYSCYLGRQLMIMLNSYDVIKEAFLQGDEFSDRSMEGWEFSGFHDAIIAAPYNNQWKQNKRFTVQALKNTGFGTPKSEVKIVNEIEVLMKYLADQKGAPFETKEPLENTTTNALVSVLLDDNYAWWSDELKNIIKISEDFMETLFEMFALSFINQYMPLFLMKIFCRKQMKQCKSKNEGLRNYIRDRMQKHKATLDSNNPRDVIDTFLAAGKDTEWGSETLASTISTFFPDGCGTVADSINWVILYMTHYPEEQKAVQKQIDEVCGGRPPTLGDRKDLSCLEALITETYRVANPVAMSGPRVALHDTTLRGYSIPREGVTVIANLYSAHMNPKDFPEPEKFKPSRFLDSNLKLINTERVIPFSVGGRMCVGSQYSRSVVFLVLSHVLQRFTLTFPSDQPNPTLQPDKYLIMRPQRYKVQAIQR